MKRPNQYLFFAFITLALALLLGLSLYFPKITQIVRDFGLEYRPKPTEAVSADNPAAKGTPLVPSEELASPDLVDGLPVGKLISTPERSEYVDAALTIKIPKLGITYSIYSGTDSKALGKGVGLYDYAQMPGEGNRNTSLAGHRNSVVNGKITDAAPFYYLDTLAAGDYIYLYDSDSIYRYLWEACFVVEADDWSPIYTTGYSCITLTSCHPIGISDHRIILRGRLDTIIQKNGNYSFPKSVEKELNS